MHSCNQLSPLFNGPPSLIPSPPTPRPKQLHVTSFKISPIFSETRFRNLQSKRKKKRTKLLKAFRRQRSVLRSNRPFSVAIHQPCIISTNQHYKYKLLVFSLVTFSFFFSSNQVVQCSFQTSVINSEGINYCTFKSLI